MRYLAFIRALNVLNENLSRSSGGTWTLKFLLMSTQCKIQQTTLPSLSAQLIKRS